MGGRQLMGKKGPEEQRQANPVLWSSISVKTAADSELQTLAAGKDAVSFYA